MDKRIWISVVVLLIIFFGGTALYKNAQNQDELQYTREEAIEDEVSRPKQTLNAKYQYKDGMHIFIGDITLPTPCHSYNAQVDQRDIETEIVVTTTESDEVCAQVTTQKQFKVQFEGQKDDLIIASLNGEVVNLNIFEIPDDQDINEIEIDIKG
jgi:hypothetical protein